jgi:outer membrane cobalamin receptor
MLGAQGRAENAQERVCSQGDAAEPARAATEEIVVTGSRIRRKDLTTPAPVTVVTGEQITSCGIASLGVGR